jgi:hypothetical protein
VVDHRQQWRRRSRIAPAVLNVAQSAPRTSTRWEAYALDWRPRAHIGDDLPDRDIPRMRLA